MVRQFFTPCALGAVLMAWLVMLQASVYRWWFGYLGPGGWHFETRYGRPPVLRVLTSGPTEALQGIDRVQVYWGTLGMVLVAAYCVAMPLGRWITGYRHAGGEFLGPLQTGRRAPTAVLLRVLGGCAATGAVAAAVLTPHIPQRTASPSRLWWIFSLVASLAAVPVALLVMTVRRWRYRRRFARRGFEVQLSPQQSGAAYARILGGASMRQWLKPNAVGVITYAFFLAGQGLCGQTRDGVPGDQITWKITDDGPFWQADFGFPTLLTVSGQGDAPKRYHVHWPEALAIIGGAWVACMAIGRLAVDGGAGPLTRSLLPPRRHPAIWLLTYIGATPALAAVGLLHDLRAGGVRGLTSPTGPSAFPLLLLYLLLAGVPFVAIALAAWRVLDRRHVRRPRLEVIATPTSGPDWPF
jgi:hypothetical protein